MKKITPHTLKKRLQKKDIFLIDVREPGEYKTECIEGSCPIPLAEVSLEKLPPDATTSLALYCRSGKRSEEACKKLLKDNPNLDICVLEGGILSWKKEGFATKSSGRNVLPLDQQVRIMAGTLGLLGFLLGVFVHPTWHFLSGFVGLGLIFSGVTGICATANLLAKMPWNQ